MKTKWMLLVAKIFFLLPLFFPSALFSSETEEITFIRVNFPPLWIVDGALKGQGIADAGEELLKKEFDQFKFRHQDVNVARAERFMTTKGGKTYCAAPHGKGFFKDTLESKIWVAISGHVLVSTEEFISTIGSDTNLTNEKKQLVLKNFLDTKKYSGLVAKEQKYPIVDSLIAPFRKGLIKDVAAPDMLGLYKMVLGKRADYTFQYESTVRYLQKLDHEMSFITMEELNLHKVVIVVGCNDTPLARKFLKAIDDDIDKLRAVGLEKMSEYHSDITYNNLKSFIN